MITKQTCRIKDTLTIPLPKPLKTSLTNGQKLFTISGSKMVVRCPLSTSGMSTTRVISDLSRKQYSKNRFCLTGASNPVGAGFFVYVIIALLYINGLLHV